MINASYTIQMASKISGVGVHTIRAWEKRYKALVPNRDSSGHRVYTKIDIEKLMLLSELCLLGYSISKVANLSIDDLKKLLIELGKPQSGLELKDFSLVEEKGQIDVQQALSILVFALKNYKPDVISQELGKIKNSLSPRELALEIILPLVVKLREAGRSGSLNSQQFDALKTLIKFHMGHHLFRHEMRENSPGHIIVSSLNGQDDLELYCIGLLCQHYHFNTVFAGELSEEAFSEFTKYMDSKIIILGTGNLQSESGLHKCLSKIKPETDVIVFGSGNLSASQSKKVFFTSTLQQIDDILSKKSH